ncbi:MAG: hypothetical protein ACREFE_10155, partial [Limisphaerales bacterium]
QQSDQSAAAPLLAPQNPDQLNLPQTLQAPPMLFQSSASHGLMPMPRPQPVSPAEQQRRKTSAENRENWAFATPEEIFGVTASKQWLAALADNGKSDKNLTPFERYLDRLSQARMGNTNAIGNGDLASPWNFSRNQSAIPIGPDQSGLGSSVQGLSRFLSGAPDKQNNTSDNRVSVGPDANYGGNLFNPPQSPQPAKLAPDQEAAMERFRQLLDPPPVADAMSPNNNFFSAPKVAVDPNITQPNFVPNPVGASFVPVSSGVRKPTGLTPLPGIVPVRSQQAVALPAWAPKPAPWLSQTPQPFAVPQRKF